MWVRFDPHRPDLFVSARDVLSGTMPADRLKGRVVLVGITAAGIQDIRSTPIDALATVELQAQIIATIMGGRALDRPPWTLWVELGLVAVVGLLLIALLPLIGPVGGSSPGSRSWPASGPGSWDAGC